MVHYHYAHGKTENEKITLVYNFLLLNRLIGRALQNTLWPSDVTRTMLALKSSPDIRRPSLSSSSHGPSSHGPPRRGSQSAAAANHSWSRGQSLSSVDAVRWGTFLKIIPRHNKKLHCCEGFFKKGISLLKIKLNFNRHSQLYTTTWTGFFKSTYNLKWGMW